MTHCVWTCLGCGKSGGEEGEDGEDAEIACVFTHSRESPACEQEPLTFDTESIARDYGMITSQERTDDGQGA